MDVSKFHADLRAYVPAERGADYAGAEVVHAVLFVSQDDGEVFGDVVEKDVQGVEALDLGDGMQEVIDECFVVDGESEKRRVASAEELERHFHEFFARELGSWKVVEDFGAMLAEEFLSLFDARCISIFNFEPPVGFQFEERLIS